MKMKMMVMLLSVLLAAPVLSFADEKKGPDQKIPVHEQAKEKAKFKHSGEVFNNKAHKETRAKKLTKKKAAEAKKAKKKAEEDQDKGEGQVKVKF